MHLGLNITRTLEGPQALVRNQPDGARNWLPCNDHPLDKATFRIEVVVPQPLVAVSNRSLVTAHAASGWTTWVWEMDAPMATYVLGIAIGPYRRIDAPPAGETSVAYYVFPADLETATTALAPTAEMIRFLEDCLGPCPFATYGYVEVTPHPGLETQTTVTLGREILGYDDLPEYMIHEHLHNWFGDSVTPAGWSEIWLNEGFATYFKHLWRSRDLAAPGCARWVPNPAWRREPGSRLSKPARRLRWTSPTPRSCWAPTPTTRADPAGSGPRPTSASGDTSAGAGRYLR